MSEVFMSDNAGNRVPPHPNVGAPTLASGQTLSPNKETNTEATVVAGANYAITAIVGWFVFGLATTATAANIIWACPQGQTIVIKIPVGYTSLHYFSGSDNRTAYLRRLTMPGD